MRYDHWFWNSRFVDSVAQAVCRFSSWLWLKQYARD